MKRIGYPLLLLILVTNAAVAEAPTDDARQWLDDYKDSGLVLVHQPKKEGFVGIPVGGGKFSMHTLSGDGFVVSLGFDGVLTKESSLADIRQAFKYVALDDLPTPGLEVDGWKIHPQTAMSSFKDGVEILDYRNGRIVVRVRTEFFALYGRDVRVQVPADAPSPEGTYFQIRQKFKLDLTIDAPFSLVK